MAASGLGTFRGVEVVRLARLLHYACDTGAITIMKRVNVAHNLGKEPCMVLAEQLILAIQDEDMGAQYDD
jgi:hypothetical protein